jgi:putative lipoic acid-binding regulatory protein
MRRIGVSYLVLDGNNGSGQMTGICAGNDISEVGTMRELPSIELLEDTHHFPTHYMFKVIGKADNSFIARTVAAVREELFLEEDPPYYVREARSSRHVAVTLEPLVRDAEQVVALYRRLVELEGLVVLW